MSSYTTNTNNKNSKKNILIVDNDDVETSLKYKRWL